MRNSRRIEMNAIRYSLLGLVATLFMTFAAQAASLGCVSGGWAVSSNGYYGTMVLTVDAAGNVTGTFLGNPVKGFWNYVDGKLTFYRAIGGTTVSTPPEQLQVYTGYSFGCVECSNGTWYIEGYFEAFAGTGATASKNVFGWSAVCTSIE
jgi:hypothetical protein